LGIFGTNNQTGGKEMKRALLGTAVVLFMAVLALPARADVDVYANIYKDKDVIVQEYVLIQKFVLLDVDVVSDGDKAAEADVIGNQVNVGNQACQNCAEKRSELIGSIEYNTGITTANQATGNANNQGNLVSVAVDVGGNGNGGGPPQDGGGFANAQASVEQRNTSNTVQATLILYRESNIVHSVNNNTGITNFNQAAGQLNNQMNATALAACLNGAVALSEADLGQATYGYAVQETGTLKTTLIQTSVNDNTGVTFVNQSSGNAANQGNVLSLAVSIHR
jgi:hypothetical protein